MIDDFGASLKNIRLKATPRRLAILDILASESVYLSPEEVWQKLKARFAKTGLPSVYRNLEALAQGGVIIQIIHPDRKLYYYHCRNGSHHHHFVCIACRKVQDLTFCGMDEIEQEIKGALKGRVISHVLQVYGLCRECSDDTTIANEGAA